MQFQIIARRENRKRQIPKSSRLESLEKFLGNKFILLDARGNTSGSFNSGGIADLLC